MELQSDNAVSIDPDMTSGRPMGQQLTETLLSPLQTSMSKSQRRMVESVAEDSPAGCAQAAFKHARKHRQQIEDATQAGHHASLLWLLHSHLQHCT